MSATPLLNAVFNASRAHSPLPAPRHRRPLGPVGGGNPGQAT
jgi:hypothetical protein